MAPPPAPHSPPGFLEQTPPGAPLISIVTATFNSERSIGRTLDSVARQRFQDLEHLVVDGASKDRTCEIARAASHGVQVFSEPDKGIYDAFNKGLARARGELIAFLNSDDAYRHAGVTARVAQAARDFPDVDIFHADLDIEDRDGRLVRAVRFRPRFPAGSPRARESYAALTYCMPIPHPTTFIRRRLWARVGGFDASYRIAGDHEFLLRAWLAGARFRHIPDVFVRMDAGGVSHAHSWKADLETLRSSRAHARSRVRPWIQFARLQTVKLLERRAPLLLAGVQAMLARLRGAPAGSRGRGRVHIVSTLASETAPVLEGGAARDRALVEYLAPDAIRRPHFLSRTARYPLAAIGLLAALFTERGATFVIQYPRLPFSIDARFPLGVVRSIFIAALRAAGRRSAVHFDVADLPVDQVAALGRGALPQKAESLRSFEETVLFRPPLRWIFASASMARLVEERHGIDPRRVQIALNGASPAPFPLTRAALGELCGRPIAEGEIALVYAGTLDRERGVADMLASLLRSRRAFRVILAGIDGGWIAREVADARVHHVGALDARRCAEVVGACDCGLLPYDPARAYFQIAYPIKLPLYLAGGVPVLSTPVAEAARVIAETGAGWVAPLEAWAEVVDAMDGAELARRRAAAQAASRGCTWPAIFGDITL